MIFKRVHFLLKNGELEKVLDLLFTKNRKSINKPYDNDLNHAWYLGGDIYYRFEDYQQAIHCFKNSILARPDDVDAILAIANCYSKINMPNKSTEWLEKGLNIDSNNNALLYNYANSLYDQGRYKEAVEKYNEVTDLDKDIYELARKNLKKSRRKISINN